MTTIHRSLLRLAARFSSELLFAAAHFEAEAQQGRERGARCRARAARTAAPRTRPATAIAIRRRRSSSSDSAGDDRRRDLAGRRLVTEILAPLLRERGKLYAAQYGSKPPFPYQSREMERFRAKLASAPAIYDKVTVRRFGFPTSSRSRRRGRPISS